jgi:hypothetical protein
MDLTIGLDLKTLIRTVPDFPRPGVMFRDITTLLKHPDALHAVVEGFVAAYHGRPIDKIAAIESRGFIVGAALAYRLRAGFVPIRKAGKLPAENFGQDYELEYGVDRLEVHRDAISGRARAARRRPDHWRHGPRRLANRRRRRRGRRLCVHRRPARSRRPQESRVWLPVLAP